MTHVFAKPGVIEVNGVEHLRNAEGHLVPRAAVKQQQLLEDEMVRDVVARAKAKAEEVRLLKEALFAELDAFNDLLDERFKVKSRGVKGNQTFTTFDGLMRVKLATSDTIAFGPELLQAKALIDECIAEWTGTCPPILIAMVNGAFNVRDGSVNAKELFKLKRYACDDERWILAMAAIDDAIRITGSKRFVLFAERDRPDDKWTNIPINIAVA